MTQYCGSYDRQLPANYYNYIFLYADTVVTPAVHCVKIQEASRSHIPLCNYLTANILLFLRATKTFQDNFEPSVG